MSRSYVGIRCEAILKAELSNGKTETVKTLVTGYGYAYSEPFAMDEIGYTRWFDYEEDTTTVCYPDEFFVKVGDNMWVEQDDGTTIEKILEVIELQDDIAILEYEEVLNEEYEKD